MSTRHKLGSPGWATEFTFMCREFGYPSTTEKQVMDLHAGILNGYYNNCDPIAVWIKSRVQRESSPKPLQIEDITDPVVEAEAKPLPVPPAKKKPFVVSSLMSKLREKYLKK
jgi:hypothetical protein